MAATSTISEKDLEAFKKADKLFQKKQFKQALKHIDGIVKKNEKYGEALALKGAILARLATNDDERADALDVCKRGVQLDLTSKMSWTHLARLYQVNMKYEDAARAYKMAIKLCNKPTQVYEKTELRRNLVTVLSQVRNWTELAELRRQMQLDNRDNGLVHWVGYLLALYNSKNYETALSVLRDLRRSAPPSLQEKKESTELILFEARILEESGKLQEALDFLSKKENEPQNKLALDEICGGLELRLGKFEEAVSRFARLIKERNPENYDYHRGLQAALLGNSSLYTRGGLSLPLGSDSSPEVKSKVTSLYEEMETVQPKSMAIKRIILDFCDEASFETRSGDFIRKNIAKHVVCLFTVLKTLYTTRGALASKVFNQVVQKLLEEMASQSSADKAYAWFFLAQHQDKLDKGSQDALNTIDKALSIEPKNADFLHIKARILKHAGCPQQAFEVVDSARQLETNDRYLNNKAAKYALRANKPDVALGLTHLFTRGEDLASLPDVGVLHEYQCMWYELESATSFARVGDIVRALKNFRWVESHFEQIRDDEYDFHDYCIRRFVINSYCNLIRMEDTLKTARAYKRAAKGAVECWLRVFDKEEGVSALKQYEKTEAAAKKAAEKESDESQFAGMTPSERKRAMKKLKDEKAKIEAAKQASTPSVSATTKSASSAATKEDEKDDDDGAAEEPGPGDEDKRDLSNMYSNRPPRKRKDIAPDPDPHGFKRFASLYRDPLKPASQLIEAATAANPKDVDLLVLAFDVAVRKREVSKAWTYLSQAISLGGAAHPAVIERLVPFARYAALSSIPKSHPWGKNGDAKFVVDDATRASLDAALAAIGRPVAELAHELLRADNHENALGAAKGLLLADMDAPKVYESLSKIVEPLSVCTQIQSILRGADASLADQHRKLVKARWPLATDFA